MTAVNKMWTGWWLVVLFFYLSQMGGGRALSIILRPSYKHTHKHTETHETTKLGRRCGQGREISLWYTWRGISSGSPAGLSRVPRLQFEKSTSQFEPSRHPPQESSANLSGQMFLHSVLLFLLLSVYLVPPFLLVL